MPAPRLDPPSRSAGWAAPAVGSGALRAWVGLLGTVCMTVGGFAYASMPRGGLVGHLDALRDVRGWQPAQHGSEHAGVALCFFGVRY